MYKPGLNCPACADRFQSFGVEPLCRTKRGCPIKDLARDVELNKTVHGYLGARALLRIEHLRPLGIKELERLGLTDPNLLVGLEERIDKYLKHVKEREQNQTQLKEDAKKHGGI